jgi:hypothetical protein
MKTKGIVGTIVALVLIVIAFFVGRNNKLLPFLGEKQKPLTEAAVDSIVQLNIQEFVNPHFTSVDEVLLYREMDAEGMEISNIFASIPDEVMTNVVGVLLKRGSELSKKSIAYEYRLNKQVYDNLPVPPGNTNTQNQPTTTEEPLASISITKEGKTTVVEAPSTGVGEGSNASQPTTAGSTEQTTTKP